MMLTLFILINQLTNLINISSLTRNIQLTGLMLTKSHLMLKKTELVNFKYKNKKPECPIKIKLSRKRLYPCKSMKYLGFKTE